MDADAKPFRSRRPTRSELLSLIELQDDLEGDTLREECGVFGIFGHPEAAAITALGLHALQHRGQEAAGIVSFDGSRFPFRTPARPRRRYLLPPRGDRAPARHHRRRPCPLLHDRRHHPAQRAAAVRRTQCRRFRGRPQRQSHQRPDAAPRTRQERRHDAVDHRHRGDPASGRAIQAQPFHRPLHRGAARDRRRLRAGRRSPTRSWSARAIRSASARWCSATSTAARS